MASPAPPPPSVDASNEAHERSLKNLREFLNEKTCYDILPESFRLIVFDNALKIKKALSALMSNGVVSAPLYDSTNNRFSGMFTLTDVIHLIQYFYLKASTLPPNASPSLASTASMGVNDSGISIPGSIVSDSAESPPSPGLPPAPSPASAAPPTTGPSSAGGPPTTGAGADAYTLAAEEVESFPLSQLRDIEQAIEVPEPPTISILPDASLFEACECLVKTHARRIPLIDTDKVTGRDAILCVLTQYRTLKFIAINAQSDVARLNRTIGSLGIGSYVSSFQPVGASPPPPPAPAEAGPSSSSAAAQQPSPTDPFHPLATATLDTTVFDVVHMFSDRGISAVPIIDEEGTVINMYESVDIVDLVRTDAYRLLDLTIAEAIARRSSDFAGVTVCSPNDSLANIIRYIGERRVHRFVVVDDGVDDDDDPGKGATAGPQGGSKEEVDDDATTPVAKRSDPLATRWGRTKRKGRLVGMLTLSDIMRYIVGVEQKTVAGMQIVGLGLNGEGSTPTQTRPPATTATTVTVTSAADAPSTTAATAESGVGGAVTATPTETSAAAVASP